jgi:hypothetical protein
MALPGPDVDLGASDGVPAARPSPLSSVTRAPRAPPRC